VVEGDIEAGKRYEETEFNRIIEIKEREAYRIKLMMGMIDQREKTIVFCANQAHALAVRDLINQTKTSKDPNYCVRVTANDGAIGDATNPIDDRIQADHRPGNAAVRRQGAFASAHVRDVCTRPRSARVDPPARSSRA